MKRTPLALLLLVPMLPLCASRVANPIIPGFHPDPSICRTGDDFYLVTSSFQFFPGVPIFHSRDLTHWEQIGNVLDRESQLPLSGATCWGGIYAPTIRHHDGKFYMITTNVTGGGNFFVTADDPHGPWSDPVWLKQGGIDPSLFWDDDGKAYMTSNPDDGIWLCELDVQTGRQLSPSRLIWSGTGGRYPEAPHIYKRDGWYYLMIAEGGTEFGHGETIARSRDIGGPYEPCPHNPILTHFRQRGQSNRVQGTGHADLVEASDGTWWMVCLAFRPQTNNTHLLGRETFLAPVAWTDDGWPVVAPTGDATGRPIVSTAAIRDVSGILPDSVDGLTSTATRGVPPTDAPTFGERPWRDDFTDVCLGPEWVYLQNPDSSRYRTDGGRLYLFGTPLTPDDEEASPTFVAHRQEDIEETWTVRMEMLEHLLDSEAGLSVYMNGASHYDFYLSTADGRTRLGLRYRLGALAHTAHDVALPSDAAWLRITATATMYTFAYSTDGQQYTELTSMNTLYLSTEVAGGFTGIVVGLYATSSDYARTPTAAFDFYQIDRP